MIINDDLTVFGLWDLNKKEKSKYNMKENS